MRRNLIYPFILVFLTGILFTLTPGSIAEEEAPEAKRYSITTPANPTGEVFTSSLFSVSVPEGWHVEHGMGDQLIVLYGDGGHRSAPYILIGYYSTDSVPFLCDPERASKFGYQEILVTIDGQDVIASEYTMQDETRNFYRTDYFICLTVGDPYSLIIEVAVDSSEFTSLSMEDADIQEIITSIRVN